MFKYRTWWKVVEASLPTFSRHDTKHNDIQYNDTQHNDTRNKDTRHIHSNKNLTEICILFKEILKMGWYSKNLLRINYNLSEVRGALSTNKLDLNGITSLGIRQLTLSNDRRKFAHYFVHTRPEAWIINMLRL